MPQYFENDPRLDEQVQPYSFSFFDQQFTVLSGAGVFSKDRLDTGTRLLLETVIEKSRPCTEVLDLGCGVGVVGIVLSRFWRTHVTGIDINEKAARLAAENYRSAGVNGTAIAQDGIEEGSYDCIVFNPPIRAGKQEIYRLFSQCAAHLKEDGALWIVMRKQHGAQSAFDYLSSLGLQVSRQARDKGFWVIKAEKSAA